MRLLFEIALIMCLFHEGWIQFAEAEIERRKMKKGIEKEMERY